MQQYFFKKYILIISPEPWGESAVSKHHYAATLAGLGNKVWFLGPESRPLDPDALRLPDRVSLLSPVRLPRGLGKLPVFIRRWIHRFAAKKLEQQAGCTFDVVWSFDSSRLYDLEAFGTRSFRILHLVDLNQDFHWKEAAASARLCIGTTTAIVERLKTVQPHTLKLGHGLPQSGDAEHSTFKLQGEGKHAVYAGNLSIPYLDWPRLLRLVKSYPEVTFHFFGDTGSGNLGAGKEAEELAALKALPNARLEGVIPPSELLGVFRQADVLFLCYKTGDRVQVGNPHKVIEYLSSGKPILSTELEAYLGIPELIRMEDDEEAYLSAFADLLNERDPSLPSRRRAYAMARTYSTRIMSIERYIQQHLA